MPVAKRPRCRETPACSRGCSSPGPARLPGGGPRRVRRLLRRQAHPRRRRAGRGQDRARARTGAPARAAGAGARADADDPRRSGSTGCARCSCRAARDAAMSRDLAAPRRADAVHLPGAATRSNAGSSAGRRMVGALTALGPAHLVLDEAHHLRREWWRALERLWSSLPDARLISLTATPALRRRVRRMAALREPLRADRPRDRHSRAGPQRRPVPAPGPRRPVARRPRRRSPCSRGAARRLAALQEELRANADLLDTLAAHPWLAAPDGQAKQYSTRRSAVGDAGPAGGGRARLPPSALELLGVTRREVPPPSGFWLQVLLDALTGRSGEPPRSIRSGSKSRPASAGPDRRWARAHARDTERSTALIAASPAKLDSIVEIAGAESASLGEGLRMVVLSDHLRAGELPQAPEDAFQPARLGVVPIFEALRRAGTAQGALGVLSGKLVILPTKALAPRA